MLRARKGSLIRSKFAWTITAERGADSVERVHQSGMPHALMTALADHIIVLPRAASDDVEAKKGIVAEILQVANELLQMQEGRAMDLEMFVSNVEGADSQNRSISMLGPEALFKLLATVAARILAHPADDSDFRQELLMVVFALKSLVQVYGISWEDVETLRLDRLCEFGGYEGGYVLRSCLNGI